jgi:leucyl-tRNA synthetase
MPGWAGSSWYFFRYMDAQNSEAFASPEALAYWKQVDLYIGGTEHATGHLLYARFWTKFLFDLGYVNVDEPFKKLVNQGMIQGVSEKATALVINSEYPIDSTRYNSRMIFVSEGVNPEGIISVPHAKIDISVDINLVNGSVTINQVKKSIIDIPALCAWRNEYAEAAFVVEGGYWKNNTFYSNSTEGSDKFITYQVVEKMSKSKYNVVNPDEIIERYGADTFRLYEMFLGPLEQSKPWNTNGIEGTYKFLRKVWRLFYSDEGNWLVTDEKATAEELRALHKLIKKVG